MQNFSKGFQCSKRRLTATQVLHTLISEVPVVQVALAYFTMVYLFTQKSILSQTAQLRVSQTSLVETEASMNKESIPFSVSLPSLSLLLSSHLTCFGYDLKVVAQIGLSPNALFLSDMHPVTAGQDALM